MLYFYYRSKERGIKKMTMAEKIVLRYSIAVTIAVQSYLEVTRKEIWDSWDADTKENKINKVFEFLNNL